MLPKNFKILILKNPNKILCAIETNIKVYLYQLSFNPYDFQTIEWLYGNPNFQSEIKKYYELLIKDKVIS